MKLIFAIGRGIINFIYFFHKLFPVKKRISFISRQNPTPLPDVKMLAAELERLSPETEIVVSCRMIGPGIIGKIKYLFYMVTKQMHLFATSKVIILDGYCIAACMLKHRKDLKIIQMWHAMGALKKFGWAAVGQEEGYSKAVAEGMRMHKGYTTVFVGSDACRELLAPAFGCGTDIMEVMPLPRTDLILSEEYNKNIRISIYKKYPQIKDKKVILYAPTFRKKTDIKPFVEELAEAVDYEKYSLVIKLHPLDSEGITSDKALIDPEFSSMKWLSCADYVVTDYSAFIFEAALAGKPLFRFVPDSGEYDEKRGFLTDPDTEIPAFRSDTAADIIKAVENGKYDPAAVAAFAKKYVDAGENNTRQMAEYILNLI